MAHAHRVEFDRAGSQNESLEPSDAFNDYYYCPSSSSLSSQRALLKASFVRASVRPFVLPLSKQST